jgi:hypothetical protein
MLCIRPPGKFKLRATKQCGYQGINGALVQSRIMWTSKLSAKTDASRVYLMQHLADYKTQKRKTHSTSNQTLPRSLGAGPVQGHVGEGSALHFAALGAFEAIILGTRRRLKTTSNCCVRRSIIWVRSGRCVVVTRARDGRPTIAVCRCSGGWKVLYEVLLSVASIGRWYAVCGGKCPTWCWYIREQRDHVSPTCCATPRESPASQLAKHGILDYGGPVFCTCR